MIGQLYKIDKHLIWVAVIGSLLLSLWAHYADDVINYDGIEYVRVAEEIGQGEWRHAVQTYKWPFYSGFIALTSLITGISPENSAHLLNAVFYALLALSFVAVVHVLGGSRAVLWIALLVFLSHPAVNKFRSFIIRDPGFLAFAFAGFYGFFVYLKGGGKRYNLAAVLCFLVAALFRVEGIMYLVVTQYIALVSGPRKLLGPGASIALFVLAGLSLLLLLSWWIFEPTTELDHTGILQQPALFLQTAWSQLVDGIAERLSGIQNLLLVKYSAGYSVFVFLAVTLTILVAEVVNSAGVVYSFLAIYGWRYGLLFPRPGLLRPWAALVLVSALFLYVFVFLQWFMTDRYPLAVTLLMLLSAPFVLHYLHRRWWRSGIKGRRVLFGLVALLLVFSGLKGLDLFTGKRYLKIAGLWLQQNMESGASLFTNNRTVEYYSGPQEGRKVYRPYQERWPSYKYTALVESTRYDYLAFRIKDKDREPGNDYAENLPMLLYQEPTVVFEGPDGALLMIFKRLL